jgi:DNA-binding FadR family transcriptional regulator
MVAVRVPKTAELVAAHVRRQIVRGELQEGDALLPENTLMEEFSISRPTLREAFRILESEGLITVRRGARGGARVHVPTGENAARYASLVLQHRGADLRDVLEARVIVEAPAAAMVASRRDRVRCAAQLQKWLDDHPATLDDPVSFHEFNRLLVALTGNETLMLVTTMLEAISDSATASYTQQPHPDDDKLARKAATTRAALIALIAKGDADGAEDLWRRHLTEAGKVLIGGRRQAVVDILSSQAPIRVAASANGDQRDPNQSVSRVIARRSARP